jgi:ATP-dependent exoDNAse (exonuclease V) beta subunit
MTTPEQAHQELLQIDAGNRRRAIDPTASFIIEAPAGAGKTELLTQRYLALLLKVNDPEEIVALTFTNKAVAEMRKRIVESLRLAQGGGRYTLAAHKQITFDLGRQVLAHAEARQWNLLEQPGRLQISTLDALCGRLVRQMPLLSRLGAQPAIATDPAPLYQQAIRDTLVLLENPGPAGEVVGRVLGHFDNDHARFARMLEAMLANRDQWLRHTRPGMQIEDAERALQWLVEDELQAAARWLTPDVMQHILPAARFAAEQAWQASADGALAPKLLPLLALRDCPDALPPTYEELPRWRGLMLLLLTDAGAIRKLLPSGLGFNLPEGKGYASALKESLEVLRQDAAEDALARILNLPDLEYSADECQLIEDLYAVLELAVANLWLVFKSSRQIDFAGMAQKALDALGGEDAPTDLQLQLDYRISHLLVDEFQDTSPTQVDLLEKLIAGWQPGDGRTLFLVGDPMQSIYRFRKADVGLFLNIREKRALGDVALEPLTLYRNNRSEKNLVEWVNTTFQHIFPPEDDLTKGAVRFSRAASDKAPSSNAPVVIHPVISRNRNDDAEGEAETPAEHQEAQKIIALIVQAQQADPKGSIAVLVRARSHLQALVDELRFHEPRILYQAVEIEPLAEKQIIQDLVALTRALSHLADRVNWLAILRAPWCGLTLADLYVLAADDHYTPVWRLMQDEARLARLSDDGRKRVRQLREVLRDAFGHQGRQRPRRWVEGVWQSIGGPVCLRDEGEYLDATRYFELLDTLEFRGSLDLERLDTELEKLFASPDPLAPETIQVMTIHKSKGLEFDTVILPGLERKTPNNEKPLLAWDQVLGADGQEHLLVAPVHLLRDQETPAKSDFLYRYEQERAANEMQRLLYVATTRAKRQLHLLGVAKMDKTGEALQVPAKGSCLSLLWDAVRAEFAAAAQNLLPQSELPAQPENLIEESLFQPRLIRVRDPGCPLPLPASPPRDAVAVNPNAASTETAEEDRAAADAGTLVHRYLEFIAKDGPEAWPLARISKLPPAMRAWFLGRDYTPQAATELVAEVLQHLTTTLESGDGQWLLRAREEGGCEVALSSGAGQIAGSHVIDRTFVEDGMRWIIDYKTTHAVAGADSAQLREVACEFKGQLDRYAALFAASGLPVKTGVFFTRVGKLVAL